MDNLSPEERSKCMSRIRSRNTTPELVVRSLLHAEGFRFRLHRIDLPGKPDLVLPQYNLAVFVHGCFWHWHPDPECPIASLPKSNIEYWEPKLARTRNRDIENVSRLERMGWRVFTIWECQLRQTERVLHRFRSFLL